MHIKKVVIEGFKSYRERSEVGELHPRYNVLVGRNGAGKSNFFTAVELVLSGDYATLRAEQRRALLHDVAGAGRPLSASVEVHFDNTDRRFPLDADEVTVKRAIGSKKDQYYVNREACSRADLDDLLEAAGLSVSNPYYIVRQGKINVIATASDAHRLRILQEVAGTGVYEERRAAVLSVLDGTEGQFNRVEELVRQAQRRAESLRREAELARRRRGFEREREALRLALRCDDARRGRDRLAQVERERGDASDALRRHTDAWLEARRLLDETERRAADGCREADEARDESDAADEELMRLERERGELELTVADLSEEATRGEEAERAARGELERLERKREELRREAREATERYRVARAAEERAARALRAPAARAARRDEVEVQAQRAERAAAEAGAAAAAERERVAELRAERARQREAALQAQARLAAAEGDRLRLREELEGAWRRQAAMRARVDALSERRDALTAEMYARNPAGARGEAGLLVALRALSERDEVGARLAAGYRGLVLDCFAADPPLHVCVEVAGGGRLLRHVVDAADTADALLAEFNARHLPGELTIVPLDRLRAADRHYPDHPNAIPLVSKLRFEERYAPAMRHVFGRTLVCRDAADATALARSLHLDCVTLDGDLATARGALSGGAVRAGLVRAHGLRRDVLRDLASLDVERAALRATVERLEVRLDAALVDVQRAHRDADRARDRLDELADSVRLASERLAAAERERDDRKEEARSLRAELETPPDAERPPPADGSQHAAALEAVARARTARDAPLNALRNLDRRVEELERELVEASAEGVARRLEEARALLRAAEESAARARARLEVAAARLRAATRQEHAARLQLDARRAEVAEAEERRAASEERYSCLAAAEARLREQLAALEGQQENDAGPLAALADLSRHEILEKLRTVSREWRRLEDADEGAVVELERFSGDLQLFQRRRDEIRAGCEGLRALMATLELKKCEAVRLTFKQVSAHFTRVLRELAPDARAALTVRVAPTSTTITTTGNIGTEVEQFTGVGMSVSFGGAGGEGSAGTVGTVAPLSGGQKCLAALAYILAIQRVDPAPVYLFDEIDQALDAEHARAVSAMIERESARAQFVASTFRVEAAERAHAHFLVSYFAHASRVAAVSPSHALRMLRDVAEAAEDEPEPAARH